MKNNTPLYIFDLDGTLALIDHRRHILDNKDNSHRWSEFYQACIYDQPNRAVVKTMFELLTADCEVWIWSGRSREVYRQTVSWLGLNTNFFNQLVPSDEYRDNFQLKMRKEGDFTPDEVLKKQWYEVLSQEDKTRLIAVFDDRQKVVDMYRSLGLTVFQVAPGDF